ncbi:hypothetical protein Btru_046564 [Bulinus truncatus]|nr:hypothetical protein Btru_046564 [Bulinus truncatus]
MKTVEDILKETGGDGRFQVMLVTFLTLPRIGIFWSMIEMSYANYVPEWCCLPNNETSQSGLDNSQGYCYSQNHNASMFGKSCTIHNSSCGNRLFVKGTDTVVNEWDLVCDRKWIVPLTTSVQMAGVLVGAFLGGQMVDMIGRRKTTFISVFFCGLFNIVAGFSVSWQMFTIFRFFIGVGIGGYFVVPTPYTMEFLSPSTRAFPNLIPASQVGAGLLALTAWRIPDWRWVHWIGGALTIPTVIGYFFVPESLRWLTVQGRVREAEEVVKYVARINRRPVPKDCVQVLQEIAENESKSATKRYTYIHLYKGWRLFKTSIILQFLWCVLSMGSYGMSFSAASLGFNLYLNIFIMNMISIPFYLSLTCLINKDLHVHCDAFSAGSQYPQRCAGLLEFRAVLTSWGMGSPGQRIGRKNSIIIYLALAGVSSLGCLVTHLIVSDKYSRDLTINILSMLFRGMQATAWIAIGIVTSEIYPTVIRGLGSGAVNTFARIGGILAPFALNLEDGAVLAFSLMSGLMVVSLISVIFLEETNGKVMQDVNEPIDCPGTDKLGDRKATGLKSLADEGSDVETLRVTEALPDQMDVSTDALSADFAEWAPKVSGEINLADDRVNIVNDSGRSDMKGEQNLGFIDGINTEL